MPASGAPGRIPIPLCIPICDDGSPYRLLELDFELAVDTLDTQEAPPRRVAVDGAPTGARLSLGRGSTARSCASIRFCVCPRDQLPQKLVSAKECTATPSEPASSALLSVQPQVVDVVIFVNEGDTRRGFRCRSGRIVYAGENHLFNLAANSLSMYQSPDKSFFVNADL